MPFDAGEHDSKLWVPVDARADVVKEQAANVVIDNRTDLDDDVLEGFFVENTAMFGFGDSARFQSYPSEGTMMARSKWRPPRNVIEEIEMARDLAERDDDVGASMDAIIAAAYHGGYQNQHADEQVEHTFEEMSEQDTGLSAVLQEMHRELLISGQVNTVTAFTRGNYDIRPENVTRVISRSVAAPLIGVLPAERVRVIGNDLFGRGQLAYVPDGILSIWLRAYFGETASPAAKRALRIEDPFAAALFIGKVPRSAFDANMMMNTGGDLYLLNPDMVQRSTFPKGSWRYPRPLLTRNFSLLEAKRLLNVMDHALLQGGINYIVVAKKGDEKKPATQPELTNLQGLVQRASRAGVLVGDHRINLEIIQPNLTEMLNPSKRQMIGRKLSQAILRVPEFGSDETGNAVQTFTELAQAVITNDRALVVGHVHRYIWRECMKRNARVFGRTDRPTIWTPKVILQGMDFWTQYLLKLYDRGDLPRKYMVEFGGYDYDAVKAQKQREVEGGHDEIFTPPAVPFTAPNQHNSPNADPNDAFRYGTPDGNNGAPDNGPGRPRGARTAPPGATPDRVRPTRLITRNRGESVRASYREEEQAVVRVGEVTERVLGEYPEATLGRVTPAERSALDAGTTTNVGNVIVVPVNTYYEIEDVQAVRLAENFSMLTGRRKPDGAIVAAAICFREPAFATHEAEDMVLRWGFQIPVVQADADDGIAPGDSENTMTCPSCNETTDNDDAVACPNCGYDGPPFSTPTHHRHHPIALTVNVSRDGEVEARQVGSYVWVTCPECGLVQDATHEHCSRCGDDLTSETKKLTGDPNRPPEKHLILPPPANQQPDKRSQPE